MKTTLLALSILACFAVASELEYRDTYNECIRAGSSLVYTDTDAALLEVSCKQ